MQEANAISFLPERQPRALTFITANAPTKKAGMYAGLPSFNDPVPWRPLAVLSHFFGCGSATVTIAVRKPGSRGEDCLGKWAAASGSFRLVTRAAASGPERRVPMAECVAPARVHPPDRGADLFPTGAARAALPRRETGTLMCDFRRPVRRRQLVHSAPAQ